MMNIVIPPGKYVVAVSGGVDSMVLLDVLRRAPGVELAVAHFDHGMRADSGADRQFVQAAAQSYDVPFYSEAGHLAADAGEAAARTARYAFLQRAQQKTGARAIITAHHQDDVLETAILNLLRGTGRLGLSSLQSRDSLLRPLLPYTKQEILAYARSQELAWREDSTNQDERFLRNYIRHTILPRSTPAQRSQLLEHITNAAQLNAELNELLAQALHMQPASDQLDRAWFVMLPYAVSAEVFTAWLRRHGIRDFDRKLVAQLVVAAKILPPGKQRDVNAHHILRITKDMLCLTPRALRKNSGSHV
jgi:tRNA(Ile)-lysidine synthetase-like protein